MKNWSCPKKIAAREATIPFTNRQYWSMASPWELDWALKTGRTTLDQFHGVEIDVTIYERNVAACPEAKWHHGDFFETMRRFRGFDPGVVNADLIQTVDTAAAYIAKIIHLLSPFDVTLVANFVMEHRGYRSTPDYVLNKLSRYQQFRWAMRSGWSFDGQCYLYEGTGDRSNTVMGTFLFENKVPSSVMAA